MRLFKKRPPKWLRASLEAIERLPEPVRTAHAHSSRHRAELLASAVRGCFYCERTFSPEAIEDWADEGEDGMGQTALCPHCGIDSVIGDASGTEISADFLQTMHRYWFE